jgi:uncharacterized OsmC-like protein
LERAFAEPYDPIMEGINFQVDAEIENADKVTLQRVLKMAEERCPAMYNMSHVIRVNAMIK